MRHNTPAWFIKVFTSMYAQVIGMIVFAALDYLKFLLAMAVFTVLAYLLRGTGNGPYDTPVLKPILAVASATLWLFVAVVVPLRDLVAHYPNTVYGGFLVVGAVVALMAVITTAVRVKPLVLGALVMVQVALVGSQMAYGMVMVKPLVQERYTAWVISAVQMIQGVKQVKAMDGKLTAVLGMQASDAKVEAKIKGLSGDAQLPSLFERTQFEITHENATATGGTARRTKQ